MNSAAVALIVVLIIALLLGFPIIWSLALASVVSIALNPELQFVIIPQRLFAGADSFSLLAVPAFMLAGDIMSKGGLSKRLVDFANAFFGWISGGLSIVALISCTFFAAISGSSVATTAAIGGIMHPEMVKKGYPSDYSAAVQAVGGTLGIVIPPSIVFVIYGNVTGASISGLLMAGIIPGILAGVALCVYAWYKAKKMGWPKEDKSDGKVALKATKNAIWALLMPVVILGGIYAGIFTPTESAVVAVFYGVLVCLLVYREMNLKKLWEILKGTAVSTANIMMLVVTAQVFAYLITYYNIPAAVASVVISVCHSKAIFLLMTILLMAIAGMFMDNGSIILILGPILAPLAVMYGINPVHYGLLIVFVLAMGQVTPPFGTCMFVACGISNRPVAGVARALLPFIGVEIVCAILFAFIPALSTFLPNLLG